MDDQTYQIIGAALEVHKELGCGFLEPVYQEAGGHQRGLLINFGNRSLQHQRFVWSHEVSTKPDREKETA
ncbi:MAG: GxxExxY protein [Chthoniobacterales bacterium]|jgi:hypothetical protein